MASDTTITTSESTTPTRTNSIHDTRKPSFEIEKRVGSDDVVHNLTIEGEMTAHVYPIMSNTKAIMLTLVVTCSMVLNVSNFSNYNSLNQSKKNCLLFYFIFFFGGKLID